jgi:hypothetical protein
MRALTGQDEEPVHWQIGKNWDTRMSRAIPEGPSRGVPPCPIIPLSPTPRPALACQVKFRQAKRTIIRASPIRQPSPEAQAELVPSVISYHVMRIALPTQYDRRMSLRLWVWQGKRTRDKHNMSSTASPSQLYSSLLSIRVFCALRPPPPSPCHGRVQPRLSSGAIKPPTEPGYSWGCAAGGGSNGKEDGW